ncbi:hypothetical protein [Streptomyces sp. NPDC051572]|uniref:hypothetical protein n=1 Tax=Streptomyces sp. NPDC051572 TaxID=3155802 RepID=UPI00344C1F94
MTPCVTSAYAQQPQFNRSHAELHATGLQLLYGEHGEGGFVPNQPGQGRPKEFPWRLVLDAAVSATRT